MKTIDVWLDDCHTHLIADVDKVDTSFDSDFGFHRRTEYNLENFQIYVVVDDIEIDVTHSFEREENKRHYNRLKGMLEEELNDGLATPSFFSEPNFDDAG